ncbi:hypothetical protein DFA_02373 [Cavenderia fasciculata]|uniref:Uncharacterized protein n=1 Tax=Cavenderia fasciculata TaxID=261658 RepID=F4PZ97_CACFS|nr:uncharacterized protein DFA_02373 [Cavenderia fasciculata]EGG19126.1 hypothetical protein DFA_02373 [Cavenderia fasciculata]|eukprot:XP_004366759.1 hypothetical protein DFA_02373 [Cavenderia fasciculata]
MSTAAQTITASAASSVSVALVPITTISASPAAATTTTTTPPTVYQRLIGDRFKPTFSLRHAQTS